MSVFRTAIDSVVLAQRWLALERPGSDIGPRLPLRKHLALLAWALPPNSNAGVHRPLSFIRHGDALGWRTTAFHSPAPANQREHGHLLLANMPPSARLIEIPSSGLQASYRLFPRIDGGFDNAVDYARSAITQLRQDPPDVVLASGPPFFVFPAARWISRALRVPCVLDYRDEWSECPFDFVTAGPDDRRFESRCLADADAVVFTTQAHREHQLTRFPELQQARAHLIPNGWEVGDFAPAQTALPAPQSRVFRIAHVGTLAGHSSPHAFLSALQALKRSHHPQADAVELDLVGRKLPETEAQLAAMNAGDYIRSVAHVPKAEATRCMQQADALLLLASKELERYLPGKLFDYVAAGRPILVYGARGEASRVVETLGNGVFCAGGSPDALAEALRELRVLARCAPAPAVADWLQAHRREHLAEQLFDLLEHVAIAP